MAWFTLRRRRRRKSRRQKIERETENVITVTLFSLISLMLFLMCLSMMIDILVKIPPFIYEGLFLFYIIGLLIFFLAEMVRIIIIVINKRFY